MTDDEYQTTQDQIVMVAQMAMALDLDAFLARLERADSVGAIIDPTLYREAIPKLRQVRELAQAAKRLADVARSHT